MLNTGRWISKRTRTYNLLRCIRDGYISRSANFKFIRRIRARRDAESVLHVLINPADCVDRYDANYIDDLPYILHETHGITEDNFRRWYFYGKLKSIADYYYQRSSDLRISDLAPFLLKELRVRVKQFSPRIAPGNVKRRANFHLASAWHGARNRPVLSGDSRGLAVVKQFQVDISLLSGGEKQVDPEPFPTRTTTEGKEPWTDFIRALIGSRVLSPDSSVLDIGPRYISELLYFREELGLKRAIGLDLYSKDPSLIFTGDMHAMPFTDSSFDLIFARTTYDKAYDIRGAIRETVRVCKPGGVVIIDDTMDYIHGVAELNRTNIKSTSQLLKMFGDNVDAILFQRDPLSKGYFQRRQGQLAIRIRKESLNEKPAT